MGRALVTALFVRGYSVVALSREPERLPFADEVERRRFNPNDPAPNPDAFAGCDAVVHLAGESVAGGWTKNKKSAIYNSRIAGTATVVASMRLCDQRPKVFACSSASGYYGDRGDEPLDERSTPGSEFLARVCCDWEREAREAMRYGIRAVQLRTGIVLGEGGALEKMAVPFRFGIGGPFGSGRQFVPWIHIDDLVRLYIHALEQSDIDGPINAVTPDYASNARFAQALGFAVRRIALIPAPGFALRAVLGEFAATLLGGQLILPAVAEDTGFAWRYPQLECALHSIFGHTDEPSSVRRFETSQQFSVPIETVFPFFAEAGNLQAITPPALHFAIRSTSGVLKRGTIMEYTLRLHGVPFRWKTMISHWEPPYRFDDVQLHGPYALWHHRHDFEPTNGGVLMRDRVLYALPLYPLGNLALPLVRSDLQRIFDFRAKAVANLAGPSPTR